MSTLETRNYVANLNDIRALAKAHRSASATIADVPRTFLRALVATTIHTLDVPVRVRFGKVAKLDADGQAAQLAALQKVYDPWYAVVVEEESEGLPAGKGRAEELNRRTNRYRTQLRAARNWIKAGNDLTSVAPGRITKRSLDVAPRVRPPDPGRVKKRTEKRSKDAVAALMELATVDKVAAVHEIELLMGQLQSQLLELGTSAPTRDPKLAMAEHRPLKLKGGALFMPMTETQVIRQQESPS